MRTFEPVRRDYDLLVTHFFLDCLTTGEAHRLAVQLRSHATEDALWVVSEFAVPANSFGRVVARPLITALYWAFGWLTSLQTRRLPEHQAALCEAGWKLMQQRNWLGGLLVSEIWQPDRRP
jgi:hypothetical protein